MKNKLENLLDSLRAGTQRGELQVITRRDFLSLTCASAVVVTPLGEVIALGATYFGPLPPQIIEDLPQPLSVVRAEDFLVIEFFFINLKLMSRQGVAVPFLVRATTNFTTSVKSRNIIKSERLMLSAPGE